MIGGTLINMKIMIVGAGGIGGYLAAMLSRKFGDITLVARGAQLNAIRENGLTLVNNGERFTVRPALCTDNPSEAGEQDVILLCTKSYGLAAALDQVRPCVKPDTLLIPMLNGVNTHKRIAAGMDKGIALDGCIYVFSRITAPGVIEKGGALNRICMGIPGKKAAEQPETLFRLRDMLNESGISTEIPDDIVREMWLKWSLISTNGQACVFFNVPVGKLRETPHMYEFLMGLVDEILLIAKAEGVDMPDDLKNRIAKTVADMPYDSTPSLLRDINEPGKPTEMDLFAGELCRMADKHGIEAPNNHKIRDRFIDRL